MARVSLILPTPAGNATIAEFCGALESAGHEVEVLIGPGTRPGQAPVSESGSRGVRWYRAEVPGPAAAAIAGLGLARGDVLIVLDSTMGYDPADLPRVAAPLADGTADLVVASRLAPGRGRLRSLLGALIRPLVGTSDPLSGLIGLSRGALESAGRFHAVGSKFSFELLAKVAAGRRKDSRRVDLTVRRLRSPRRLHFGWDDVRHLKRLSDHRFGNLSRLVQFCVVGASGAIVDLTTYAGLEWVFARLGLDAYRAPLIGGDLNLALAGVVAVSVAVVWNFSLNRRLTFNDSRHNPVLKQFFTYALSNAVSVPLSLFLRLWLPQVVPFFSDHRLMAAAVGIVAGTGISFSMSRWLVFRRSAVEPETPPTPIEGGEEVDGPHPAPRADMVVR